MADAQTVWYPVRCEVQLNFVSTKQGAKEDGAYSGISTITYQKIPLKLRNSEEANTELSTFENHLATVVAARSALHFHAYTSPVASLSKFKTLSLESYRVVRNGKPLKVVGVTEEFADTAAPSAKSKKDKPHQSKPKKGKPSTTPQETGEEVQPLQQQPDYGSKLVTFSEGDSLGVGATVELAVTFTAPLQSWDLGGVYRPQHCADDSAVLTHFEVSLARFAFPCPDSPHYRLHWQWRSLTLPIHFQHVYATGALLQKREMEAQRAVQYTFDAFGPAPAYTFAFCALRQGTVVEVSSTLSLGARAADREADEAEEVALQVVATTDGGVSQDTLSRVEGTVREATALLADFFQSPLPLLGCTSVTVLLAPTMPFIAGMEHHCCIFLNEQIYAAERRGGGPTLSAANAAKTQVELVVHELAHHWVGNAIGLPFAIKEGVCQVLEQYFGSVVMGSAQKVDAGGHRHGRAAEGPGAAAPALAETEKGKEFTGHSYQKAEAAVKSWIALHGFAAFQRGMRALVTEAYTNRAQAVAEGTCDPGEVSHLPGMAFLSTSEFMNFLLSAA